MHVVEQRAAGHKVLSEATYRACLLQGSKMVDSAFQDWLTEFVGRTDFKEWRTSSSKDYLSLMAQWETIKRSFDGSTPEVGRPQGFAGRGAAGPLAASAQLQCMLAASVAEECIRPASPTPIVSTGGVGAVGGP